MVQQSLLTEDSYVMQKIRGPCEKVSGSLRFMNDYLPEDRDPVHAWPVIFFVSLLTLTGTQIFANHNLNKIQHIRKMLFGI